MPLCDCLIGEEEEEVNQIPRWHYTVCVARDVYVRRTWGEGGCGDEEQLPVGDPAVAARLPPLHHAPGATLLHRRHQQRRFLVAAHPTDEASCLSLSLYEGPSISMCVYI